MSKLQKEIDRLEGMFLQYRRQSLACRGKRVLGGGAHSERYIRKNPGHSPAQRVFFLWGRPLPPPPPLACSALLSKTELLYKLLSPFLQTDKFNIRILHGTEFNLLIAVTVEHFDTEAVLRSGVLTEIA